MCNLSFSHITPHWPTAKAIASLHSRSIWIKNRSLGRSLTGDVADPWETPLTASCSSYQIPVVLWTLLSRLFELVELETQRLAELHGISELGKNTNLSTRIFIFLRSPNCGLLRLQLTSQDPA